MKCAVSASILGLYPDYCILKPQNHSCLNLVNKKQELISPQQVQWIFVMNMTKMAE